MNVQLLTTSCVGDMPWPWSKHIQTHFSKLSQKTNSMEQSPSWEANSYSVIDKRFPAFHRTCRFITIFIRSHHWPMSWARWIQFTPHIQFLYTPPSWGQVFAAILRRTTWNISISVTCCLKVSLTEMLYTGWKIVYKNKIFNSAMCQKFMIASI